MSGSLRSTLFLCALVVQGVELGFFGGFLFPAMDYDGSLFPTDPSVCTNTTLHFTCTLDSTPVENRSIQFFVQTKLDEYQLVSNKQEINSSLAVFDYYFEPQNTVVKVECFYLENGEETATPPPRESKLGATSMPDIYTMPHEVQDFKCIVKNYIDSMNCSWDYGIQYIHNVFEVIFEWRIPVLSGTWNPCPSLNKDVGYCYWNSTRQGDFSLKNIEVRITIKQQCNMSVVSNFRIDTNRIVKPDPVVGLKGRAVNSTCIEVTWNSTWQGFIKEHMVYATSKWPDDVHNLAYNTTFETEQLPQKRMFCDLQEDTLYTFTVGIRDINSTYWSDARTTDVKTFSDVPSASPEFGGYQWKNKDCVDTDKKRMVCLFWKLISKEDENGNMKGIDLFFSAPSHTSQTVSLSIDSTYGCSLLDCNSDYTVGISARNEKGSSKVTEFQILSANAGLQQPKFIVEMDSNSTENGTQVTVTWQYDGQVQPDNFTVALCHRFSDTCKNNEPIQWYTVGHNYSKFSIYLTSPDDFLYGVSTSAAIGSSGNQWETCIYSRDTSPSRDPKNVVVTVGEEYNSLVVTWDKLTCAAGQPYIEKYIIKYCDRSDCKETSVPESDSRKVIKDLIKDTSYSFTVRGVARNGHEGPSSQAVVGVPINKNLTTDEIFGISMGVIVGLIFAAIGMVCMFKKCKNRVSKKLREAGEVKIPEPPPVAHIEANGEIPDRLSITTTLERQMSNDSGYVKTPEAEKGTKIISPFITRPDGYAVATTEHGPFERAGSESSAIEGMRNSTYVHDWLMDSGDKIVNTVHEPGITTPFMEMKTLVIGDTDNTDVKTAGKQKLGVSGLIDGYSRATISEKTATLNYLAISGSQKNNVKGQFSRGVHNGSMSSTPDYVSGHISKLTQYDVNAFSNDQNSYFFNGGVTDIDDNDFSSGQQSNDDAISQNSTPDSKGLNSSKSKAVVAVPNIDLRVIPCPIGCKDDTMSSCGTISDGDRGSTLLQNATTENDYVQRPDNLLSEEYVSCLPNQTEIPSSQKSQDGQVSELFGFSSSFSSLSSSDSPVNSFQNSAVVLTTLPVPPTSSNSFDTYIISSSSSQVTSVAAAGAADSPSTSVFCSDLDSERPSSVPCPMPVKESSLHRNEKFPSTSCYTEVSSLSPATVNSGYVTSALHPNSDTLPRTAECTVLQDDTGSTSNTSFPEYSGDTALMSGNGAELEAFVQTVSNKEKSNSPIVSQGYVSSVSNLHAIEDLPLLGTKENPGTLPTEISRTSNDNGCHTSTSCHQVSPPSSEDQSLSGRDEGNSSVSSSVYASTVSYRPCSAVNAIFTSTGYVSNSPQVPVESDSSSKDNQPRGNSFTQLPCQSTGYVANLPCSVSAASPAGYVSNSTEFSKQEHSLSDSSSLSFSSSGVSQSLESSTDASICDSDCSMSQNIPDLRDDMPQIASACFMSTSSINTCNQMTSGYVPYPNLSNKSKFECSEENDENKNSNNGSYATKDGYVAKMLAETKNQINGSSIQIDTQVNTSEYLNDDDSSMLCEVDDVINVQEVPNPLSIIKDEAMLQQIRNVSGYVDHSTAMQQALKDEFDVNRKVPNGYVHETFLKQTGNQTKNAQNLLNELMPNDSGNLDDKDSDSGVSSMEDNSPESPTRKVC